MTATRSLRSRLAWSASVVVALWLAVLTVAANLLLGAALAGQADTLLRARAEATASTVEVHAGGQVGVVTGRDDSALDVGTWIYAPDGTLVERPPGTSSGLDAAAAGLAHRGSGTTEVGMTEPVRMYALPVREGTRRVATVVTSTSLAPYESLRRLAWIGSALLTAGLLVGVHVVLRANVGRALRPVQEMTAQADRWSADHIERRFGDEPRPAELNQLARTLDAVLERLDAVLRRERRLSDELSHELRTPLTRIQAELDLLGSRRRSLAEQRAAHASIAEATETMQQIVDTLMTSARASTSSVTGRCRPRPVIAGLADRLHTSRPGLRVEVAVDAQTSVGVEPALLERLLSPVLENAFRYARHRVEVTGEPVDGRLRLLVADDGPGLTHAARQHVFEAGWRADPGDGHPGAGLGLALARRLTEAAGGGIRVADGAAGAQFVVDLPLA